MLRIRKNTDNESVKAISPRSLSSRLSSLKSSTKFFNDTMLFSPSLITLQIYPLSSLYVYHPVILFPGIMNEPIYSEKSLIYRKLAVILHDMLDFKIKFKRQIEILGLCLAGNYDGTTQSGFAEIFGVEELTIKRDLNDLRAAGIAIHSAKGKGIVIDTKPAAEKIREFIKQYSALISSGSFVEKSTALLVAKQKEEALANMVVLQMCIDSNTMAVIDYEKDADVYERGVEIAPLLIFQTDNYWRLLTMDQGRIKQFLMNKILHAKRSPRTFKPVSKEKIDDVFKYSFRSWLGEDTYSIKLIFSSYWADRLKPKQLLDSETFTQKSDGRVEYTATVNSLDEIAGWIVTRGEGVKVVEPPELKKRVIELAEGVLKNYK